MNFREYVGLVACVGIAMIPVGWVCDQVAGTRWSLLVAVPLVVAAFVYDSRLRRYSARSNYR